MQYGNNIPPDALQSTLPALDWNTFFETVQQAFNVELQASQWPDSDKPVYVEDFPKQTTSQGYDTSLDVILWSVHGSVMSTTAKHGPHGPITPNGIHLRGRQPS